MNLRKRLKNIGWLEVLGVAAFFFILASSAFFILRRGSEVVVTMRLLERNEQDFYFNLPKNFYVENLKVGMKETDELGRNALEVLEVYKYPLGEVYQNVFVELKVKTTFNQKTGQHSLNGRPLLVGEYFSFRLKDIVLNGMIIDIAEQLKVRERKTFIVEAYLDLNDNETLANTQQILVKEYNIVGVKNYLAEKVLPGLKMIDSKGNVDAEILSVKKSPGKRLLAQSGRFITVLDSGRTEVFLTLRLTAEKIDSGYYFQKTTPLIIEKKFTFVAGELSIIPTITSLKVDE